MAKKFRTLRDRLTTDKGLEEGGVWLDVQDVARFLCRRFHQGNLEASRAYREATEAVDEDQVLSPEDFAEVMGGIWADHVVADWSGITEYDFDEDAEETPVPYSPEKARDLFNLYPEVLSVLVDEAAKRENYLAALRKKQAKNS